MTRQPVSCPVCGRIIVESLLENFHISKVFQCKEEGHIFFIRASDLEVVDSLRASA